MAKPFTAYQGDGPYVFVCYSHEDGDVVFPEIQWLKDQGFNIWFDEGISPGSQWRDEVAHSIEGASLFLYFASPTSVTSEHCKREINFAIEQKLPILVVHLQETVLPSGLAMSLSSIQAIMRYELPELDYKIKLLQSIAREIERGIGSVAQTSTTNKGVDRRIIMATLLGLVGLVIATALMYSTTSPTTSAPGTRAIVRLPINLDIWGPGHRSNPRSVAISPDGKTLVFVATDGAGNNNLKLQYLDQLSVSELPGTVGAQGPFFSPDGNWVGFFADKQLKRIAVSSGETSAIAGLTTRNEIRGATWMSNNEIVYAVGRSGLKAISISTREIRTVTVLDEERLEESHRLPHHVAGTQSLLYSVFRGVTRTPEIWVLDLSTNKQQYLFDGLAPTYSAGHILYLQKESEDRGSLWATPFDLTSHSVTGPAKLVQSAVGGLRGTAFAVASGGPFLYLPFQGAPNTKLVLLDPQGTTRTLAEGKYFATPRFSNDGNSIAVTVWNTASNTAAIWIFDTRSSASHRFIDNGNAPLWSPDDSAITFTRVGEGLFRRNLDTPSQTEQLVRHARLIWADVWADDGKTLVYHAVNPETGADLLTLVSGEEPHVAYSPNAGPVNVTSDDQWIALCTYPRGLFVGQFPDVTFPSLVDEEGCNPKWGDNNRQLFFSKRRQLWAVAVDYTAPIQFGEPRSIANLGERHNAPLFDVDNSGRIVMAQFSYPPAKPAVVVMNWQTVLDP